MNCRPYLVTLFGASLFSLLGACGAKNDQFSPDQPEEKYNQTQSVLQKQLSVVNIPVEVSMQEVEKALNAQLQGILYEDSSLTDHNNDNLMLKVWKRENITIDAASDLFSITVPLRVWAKVGYGIDRFGIRMYDYRETDFELNAKLVSQITVASDWQVHTKTSPNGFDWVKKPYLKIGPIEIPISGVVGRIIDDQLQTIPKDLDAQIRQKIPLRQYMQQAWSLVQAPVQVSEEYNSWLKVTPTEVLMTPLTGQGRKAKALIGVKGYTETFIGQKPDPASVALPPLQVTPQIPDDFAIGLIGEVSHAYATQLVAKQLVNQNFQNGSYKVTVTTIDLYGNGDYLIIKAGLAGSINGIIYLRGKPYYDPQHQTVELQQLDFDLDTKSKLIKTAAWLAHGTFVRKMQDAFKIPVGSQLTEARNTIQNQLKNNQVAKGIYLNGKLDEFTPSGVIITPGSIIAVVLAKGKVDVKIDGLL